MCPFSPKLPSHPGCHITWGRVPSMWFTIGNIYCFFFVGKTYFEFPQGTQPLCKGLESQRKSSSLVQVVTGSLQPHPGWRRRLYWYICTFASCSSSRESVAVLLPEEPHPWWWVCRPAGVSLPVTCAPTLNSSSLKFSVLQISLEYKAVLSTKTRGSLPQLLVTFEISAKLSSWVNWLLEAWALLCSSCPRRVAATGAAAGSQDCSVLAFFFK